MKKNNKHFIQSLNSNNSKTHKFAKNQIILINAKPKSSKSCLEYNEKDNVMIAYLHSIPDKNKANEELIKLFKKQYKLRVELINGFKSKKKKIKVL